MFMEDYLRYVKDTEPPILYHKWAAVHIVAGALSRKVWLQWDEPTYPNFYIVLVGKSGCRKGTALKVARRLMNSAGIEVAADSSTRESIIKELTNTSQEAMTEDGISLKYSAINIFSPELTVFLGYDNKTLVTALTDWYDCADSWSYKTKNMGEFTIENVMVNLIGATTPSLLQGTIHSDDIGGGLTSRIIFVYAEGKEKSVPLPFEMSYDHEGFESLARELDDIAGMVGEFKVNDEFIETWVNYYESPRNIERFQDARFDGYNNRRAKHLLKLCIVASAMRSREMIITKEDFNYAHNLLNETENLMTMALLGVGSNLIAPLIERINSILNNSKNNVITMKELMKVVYHDYNVDQIVEAVRTMEKMGSLEQKVDKETRTRYLGLPGSFRE